MSDLPFKVSVLVFLKNQNEEFLLLKRKKAPNKGCWSPIGGKLHMDEGESPYQCAIRETFEETGHSISQEDLHLFCMISEKAYEGHNHWLLFLFDCKKPLDALPPSISEGDFGFFSREKLDDLPLPQTDKEGLWETYDRYKDGFVALRADCTPGEPLKIITEEVH